MYTRGVPVACCGARKRCVPISTASTDPTQMPSHQHRHLLRITARGRHSSLRRANASRRAAAAGRSDTHPKRGNHCAARCERSRPRCGYGGRNRVGAKNQVRRRLSCVGVCRTRTAGESRCSAVSNCSEGGCAWQAPHRLRSRCAYALCAGAACWRMRALEGERQLTGLTSKALRAPVKAPRHASPCGTAVAAASCPRSYAARAAPRPARR